MSANGARVIGETELTGNWVDVNNDGSVSPFDALLVINFLGEAAESGGQSELVAWSPLELPETQPKSLTSDWTNTPQHSGGDDLQSRLVDSTGEGGQSESVEHDTSDRSGRSDSEHATETPHEPEITGKTANSDSFLNNSPAVDAALNELIASFDTVFSEPVGGEAI